MQNNKTFYKRCSTREQAVDFAEKSQGTIQEDGCTVAFDAFYSISKALFNVKSVSTVYISESALQTETHLHIS